MNASRSSKPLGVTAPLSLEPSTEAEKEETKFLEETLKKNELFESEEEARRREIVLGKINVLVKEFVKKVYLKKNFSLAVASQAGGKIFTYGSYRLGVHSSGTDIDTLCVVPKHVKREDFFKDFYEILKNVPEIKELTPVEEAYVPIITMEFSDIPIDLIFASIDASKVSEDLELTDNNILRNLDEPTVRSLNGSRVTDDILRLVPNIQEFRMTLRCIKFWAKRRAISANVYGFFGGVAWAMLVARVCQLYPNATASSLISKFFFVMSQWKWPNPILLREIETCNIPLRVWNPNVYPSDRAHRMPIITPAFPSMCSTHNVSASTQAILTQELKRGVEITKSISEKKATWDDLFKKETFFFNYKYYIKLTAYSNEKNLQLKWSGTVESKVRQLVMALEQSFEFILIHPYPKGFEQEFKFELEDEVNKAIQERFININDNKELEDDKVLKKLYTSSFYLGLLIKPRPDDFVGKRQLVLWKQISDFQTRMATLNLNKENSGITIGSVKNENLPDTLFTSEELQLRKFKYSHPKNGKRAREESNIGSKVTNENGEHEANLDNSLNQDEQTAVKRSKVETESN
ncbi:Poly(A) polymerase [Neoconidiobolus thromboides FSU 785]|nr:Poly(A) polymerase [Neoconidiobolus thromboides FSU 785]